MYLAIDAFSITASMSWQFPVVGYLLSMMCMRMFTGIDQRLSEFGSAPGTRSIPGSFCTFLADPMELSTKLGSVTPHWDRAKSPSIESRAAKDHVVVRFTPKIATQIAAAKHPQGPKLNTCQQLVLRTSQNELVPPFLVRHGSSRRLGTACADVRLLLCRQQTIQCRDRRLHPA